MALPYKSGRTRPVCILYSKSFFNVDFPTDIEKSSPLSLTPVGFLFLVLIALPLPRLFVSLFCEKNDEKDWARA